MRNFDCPWKAFADVSNPNLNLITSLKYDYIGSSVCGHNLALPPKAVTESNKIIYKDLYGRLSNGTENKLSTYRVYKSDDENSNEEKLISGL